MMRHREAGRNKDYDSDAIVEHVATLGAVAVISPYETETTT
jgi:hypothetical protein